MKSIDIRKIYVCEIEKINDLYQEKTDEDDIASLMGRIVVLGKKVKNFYSTDENDVSYGLFVKGLTGYKHILTGAKYKVGAGLCPSIGEHIINPDNIELLSKRERELVSHLIAKYKSFDMDYSVIKALEDHINNNAEFIVEDEDTSSKLL